MKIEKLRNGTVIIECDKLDAEAILLSLRGSYYRRVRNHPGRFSGAAEINQREYLLNLIKELEEALQNEKTSNHAS